MIIFWSGNKNTFLGEKMAKAMWKIGQGNDWLKGKQQMCCIFLKSGKGLQKYLLEKSGKHNAKITLREESDKCIQVQMCCWRKKQQMHHIKYLFEKKAARALHEYLLKKKANASCKYLLEKNAANVLCKYLSDKSSKCVCIRTFQDNQQMCFINIYQKAVKQIA